MTLESHTEIQLPIAVASNIEGRKYIVVSRLDSDLEAISHNLADVSFTSLPFQVKVITNYLNQLFISY
jgi:hypothetical protein